MPRPEPYYITRIREVTEAHEKRLRDAGLLNTYTFTDQRGKAWVLVGVNDCGVLYYAKSTKPRAVKYTAPLGAPHFITDLLEPATD